MSKRVPYEETEEIYNKIFVDENIPKETKSNILHAIQNTLEIQKTKEDTKDAFIEFIMKVTNFQSGYEQGYTNARDIHSRCTSENCDGKALWCLNCKQKARQEEAEKILKIIDNNKEYWESITSVNEFGEHAQVMINRAFRRLKEELLKEESK